MAAPGCDRQNLLNEFQDNETQQIQAASMRLLINCVYDSFVDYQYVIDNLQTYESKMALSARQGAVLNDKIEQQSQDIINLDSEKADLNLVYTKAESDTRYYSQNYINANYYTVNQVYDKTEVDNLVLTLETLISDIHARIDNLVIKNNLQE